MRLEKERQPEDHAIITLAGFTDARDWPVFKCTVTHILDLGTVSGTFISTSLPALLPGLAWNTSQLYSAGTITVVSAGVPGDYSNNGVADAADYVVWRKNHGTTNPLPNDSTDAPHGTTGDVLSWTDNSAVNSIVRDTR